MIPCRHGCVEAVAIVYAPEGCICFTDPVQALCEQHLLKLFDNVPNVWVICHAIETRQESQEPQGGEQ